MARPACPAPMMTAVTMLIAQSPHAAIPTDAFTQFTTTVTFVGLVTMS
jgi:hypothetical protein